MFYFAYGSNMNPERMKSRKAYFNSFRKARLKGYQLKFNKVSTQRNGEGFANIVINHGSIVEGLVYEIDKKGLKNLDFYENFPVSYRREILTLELENLEILEASVYIANNGHTAENLLPSSEYISHLLKARKYLTSGYIEFLENHPTL